MSAGDDGGVAAWSLCTRCNLLCSEVKDCELGTLEHPSQTPSYHVEGAAVSEDAALQRATEVLLAARRPLVFGLTRHNVDTVRAAAALADRLRAMIDVEISDPHRAAIRAEQQVGQLSASLTEMRERADAILFLNADPMRTHPRLLERLENPTQPRNCLSVAERESTLASHPAVQTSMQLGPEEQWRMLRWLRYSTLGRTPPDGEFSRGEVERATAVADRLSAARYLVVCWEPPDWGPRSELWVTELLQWLADLNGHKIAVSWAMTARHAMTAEMVLTWQTGYPCSVDFSQGIPRYDPQQSVGHRVLREGATDGALLIGCAGDLAIHKQVAWIALDCPSPLAERATVSIQTAGATFAPGVYFRGDGVALATSEPTPSLGSVDTILNRIASVPVRALDT